MSRVQERTLFRGETDYPLPTTPGVVTFLCAPAGSGMTRLLLLMASDALARGDHVYFVQCGWAYVKVAQVCGGMCYFADPSGTMREEKYGDGRAIVIELEALECPKAPTVVRLPTVPVGALLIIDMAHAKPAQRELLELLVDHVRRGGAAIVTSVRAEWLEDNFARIDAPQAWFRLEKPKAS